MNIGIIIHSNTGNTLLVGEKIKENLVLGGHTVNIERVTAVNEKPKPNEKIQLSSIPDVKPYDAIIIAAPVHAFSLSLVMRTYLEQLPDLSEKKISCYVTQSFSKAWLGGNRSVKQFVKALSKKSASITNTGVVNWNSKIREQQISDIAVKFGKM